MCRRQNDTYSCAHVDMLMTPSQASFFFSSAAAQAPLPASYCSSVLWHLAWHGMGALSRKLHRQHCSHCSTLDQVPSPSKWCEAGGGTQAPACGKRNTTWEGSALGGRNKGDLGGMGGWGLGDWKGVCVTVTVTFAACTGHTLCPVNCYMYTILGKLYNF